MEPGGLVELDQEGRYLRGTDAADPDVDPQIRPYSLAILPEIDRVISTTADMRGKLLPTSVQLWQLSELRLMKTVLLPPGEHGDENQMPAEPRALPGRPHRCREHVLVRPGTCSPSSKLRSRWPPTCTRFPTNRPTDVRSPHASETFGCRPCRRPRHS